MRDHTNRFMCVLLSFVMLLALTACGSTAEPGAADNGGEPKTLTIGIPLKSNVTDYDDNALTKWFEEKTGYDLQFVFFSSNTSEAKTQLATMTAGGEALPDVLFGIQLNTDERYVYGQDGYLLDLAPYLNDTALTAEYRARIRELYGDEYWDQMMSALASPDGGVYGFPSAVVSENDLPCNMAYINKTWLDQLGLEVPRTWDDLVTVLRAFRDNDCNGNGIHDEVPACGANITRCRIGNWLINNFERVHDNYYFNVTDGKLWLPYTSENYRRGLQAIRDLVKEGLLSELSWSMSDQAEMKSFWSPVDDVPIAGMVCAHISTFMNTDSPLMYDYVPLLPLEGAYAPIMTKIPSTNCYITTECKDPDAAFDFLLLCSTEEGSMAIRYGQEGEDWEWTKDYGTDQTSIKVMNQDAFTGQTRQTWGLGSAFCMYYSQNNPYHTAITHSPEELTWTEVRNKKNVEHANGYLKAFEATEPAGSVEWTTVYNAEEQEEMGNIMADIYNYVRSSLALFAVGDLDPYNDADWNNYVTTVENMGLATWERLGQQSYDRFTGGN